MAKKGKKTTTADTTSIIELGDFCDAVQEALDNKELLQNIYKNFKNYKQKHVI